MNPTNGGPTGQTTTQASPTGEAFSSSLRDMLAGMAMGSTPQESMSMAGRVMAVHGGQREQQQRVQARQNMTAQWLQGQGVDANTASYLVSDPEALRSWFGERQKSKAPHTSPDITEYEYAKKQGFDGNFEQWMQRKRAGAGEYGMQPIWGTGSDGKPAVLQLGKGGEAVQSKLPEGFTISRDPIRVEGPTGTTILDPQTRQQVGFIPKDVQGAAAAHQRGEAQGTAQAALPSALNNAEQSLKLVDEIIKHPGRSTATGASGTFDPRNYVPGTDAKDFQVRAEQLKGRTFLEAFQSLKGGGAITEREGQAATAAVARLNTEQSDAEYLNALNELKGIIAKGVEVLRQKAGVPGGGGGGSPVAAASAGHADLKAKYGLD